MAYLNEEDDEGGGGGSVRVRCFPQSKRDHILWIAIKKEL